MSAGGVHALLFDVFGTIVDWRGGIIEEGRRIEADWGVSVDWARFADHWRSLYQPSMERVRSGQEPWSNLDSLHLGNLRATLAHFDMPEPSPERLKQFNTVWHRLPPWPDCVQGLTRLKTRYITAAHSNGNMSLLVNLSRNARLPWDVIIGAEVVRHYKPAPEAYLKAVALLGLEPSRCMMVAAHNDDLAAAADCGLGTAFVRRPYEHGVAQETDLVPERDWDVITEDLGDLSFKLENNAPCVEAPAAERSDK